MLDVSIRVTESPVHLIQIEQIAIHNSGQVNEKGETIYRVYDNGEPVGTVEHFPGDGALSLLGLAVDLILSYRILLAENDERYSSADYDRWIDEGGGE